MIRGRSKPRALLEIKPKTTWRRNQRPAAADVFEEEVHARVEQAQE
jgi:hypothetical protein